MVNHKLTKSGEVNRINMYDPVELASMLNDNREDKKKLNSRGDYIRNPYSEIENYRIFNGSDNVDDINIDELQYFDVKQLLNPSDLPGNNKFPNLFSKFKNTENKSEQAEGRRIYEIGGIASFAFYKSFRFVDQNPYPKKWGIFISESGLHDITEELISIDQKIQFFESQILAFFILLEHERYHYWVDIWCLMHELSTYNKQKSYEYYFYDTKNIEFTEYDYEETLANIHVLKNSRGIKLNYGKSAESVVKKFLLNGPSPYSNILGKRSRFKEMENTLVSSLIGGCNNRNCIFSGKDAEILQLKFVFDNHLSISKRSTSNLSLNYNSDLLKFCPTYVIEDSKTSGRRFIQVKLTECERFIKKYLNGQELPRTHHKKFEIDNKEVVKIPNPHLNDLKVHEFFGILKKSGMNEKEFREERVRTKTWSKNVPRHPPKMPIT